MFRTSLLFCALFVISLDAARFPNLLNNLGNARLHSSMMEHQNAAFGEGIRDWFMNMRNRISNQLKAINPFDLNSSALKNSLKNNKESDETIQPTYFFLDLSTLKFEPGKDWGFRIGSWYIIRKSDDRNEQDNWNDFFESTSQSDSTPNTPLNDVEEVGRPITEVTLDNNNKPVDENETIDKSSAEVLKPLI